MSESAWREKCCITIRRFLLLSVYTCGACVLAFQGFDNQFGLEHFHTVTTVHNLAKLYTAMGKVRRPPRPAPPRPVSLVPCLTLSSLHFMPPACGAA
jgi:hypothetical protein